MKEWVVRLHGKVQGVGYRLFVRRAASKHSVTGYVKNLPDGSVEIVAQGVPDDVHAFLREAKRGPFSARKERVEESEREAGHEYERFEIRY